MYAFLLLLIIFIVIVLVVGLPVVLTIYVYKKVHKTKFKKYAFLIPALIIGFLVYEIYVAIYPLDSFYKEDFVSETNIDFPASGDILSKDANYSDIHGHYTSVAVVQLSPTDYKQLLNKINSDMTFKADTSIGESDLYEKVTNNIKQNEIKQIVRKGKMVIGFVNDNKRIVLERHLSDN